VRVAGTPANKGWSSLGSDAAQQPAGGGSGGAGDPAAAAAAAVAAAAAAAQYGAGRASTRQSTRHCRCPPHLSISCLTPFELPPSPQPQSPVCESNCSFLRAQATEGMLDTAILGTEPTRVMGPTPVTILMVRFSTFSYDKWICRGAEERCSVLCSPLSGPSWLQPWSEKPFQGADRKY
jgi:hypothetical protein